MKRYLALLVFVAGGFLLALPSSVEAQCGDCEWQGPGYECVGNNQPNEPPYCSGTWILGIACWTCGITEEEEEQQSALASLNQYSSMRTLEGVAIPGAYLAPTGCATGKVARVYTPVVAATGHALVELVTLPEPATIEQEAKWFVAQSLD